MTVLLAVVALVLAVVLFVFYRRLQDADYWRAHWSRRYAERDAELSAALSDGQEFRASVEHALRTLWRRFEVVTPEDRAAVAVLRATFPSLPPGRDPFISVGELVDLMQSWKRPLCPNCQDATCVAPGQCDDLFGGDAP
ncbi:hypothetical protein [Myxococcus sp. Y35]|uniref:hypothetical protein n=1 Tax=Pseudomyxococcus flavus TaxID=3115648 RepID=UPI003CEA5FB2